MNIRRNIIYISLFALSMSLASAAWAQPSGFGAVTAEKIAELESMHQQATDFLIQNDFQGALRTYSDILLMEPDDETAYTGLGQIYMVQGRHKLAHEAFKNALYINGDNEVALAGIRRIMDPDGVEGMVSKPEIETESYLAEEKIMQNAVIAARSASIKPAPMRARIVPAPQADMAQRQSAVKVKKGYVSPVPPTPAVKTVVIVPARTRQSPRLGRLGLLHAQRTQMALLRAGFYKGPVNGMVGGSTKASLREFQKNFGIVPSGRMTSATLSKLSEYLSL